MASLGFSASNVWGSDMGRWLVMDNADIDGDGDEDILLRSFADLLEKTSYISKQQQYR